eukprot:GFYU01014119.1.p1 GENE.GFYU01014119.1~~GFYU01014119.1.p1  ORF type:complete len:177 (+),score=26.97 GFYU01014119.1:112-642(+)
MSRCTAAFVGLVVLALAQISNAGICQSSAGAQDLTFCKAEVDYDFYIPDGSSTGTLDYLAKATILGKMNEFLVDKDCYERYKAFTCGGLFIPCTSATETKLPCKTLCLNALRKCEFFGLSRFSADTFCNLEDYREESTCPKSVTANSGTATSGGPQLSVVLSLALACAVYLFHLVL